MAKLKAAVIFGGTSKEHQLSLSSAADVVKNIPRDKYEVICIGITRKGRWLYFPGSPDEIASGEWKPIPIVLPQSFHLTRFTEVSSLLKIMKLL